MLRLCEECMELTVGGMHCTKCGKKTIPLYLDCPHCKKQISINNAFCKECGRPVQEDIKIFKDKMRKEVNHKEKEDSK